MRWRQSNHRPREVPLEEAREPAALDSERPNLDEVLHALARLSFNQRSALVMRELEGRSYQEIASTLNLSTSAVEALIFRARRNLQLKRRALGVLSTAPLPGSLTSLLGTGGSAVGGAIGTEVVVKAAALFAAGALTAGAGYESVKAVMGFHHTVAAAQAAPLQGGPQAAAQGGAASSAKPATKSHANADPALRGAVPSQGRQGVAAPSAVAGEEPASAAAQAQAPQAQPAQSPTQAVVAATTPVTGSLPAPPAAPVPAPVPALPPSPVNVPPVAVPQVPVPPVPVTVPPLPVTVPPLPVTVPPLPVTVPTPPALPVKPPPLPVAPPQNPLPVPLPPLPPLK
jgi:hypothetical protein